MLIPNQYTIMKWHPKNKQYYIDKGYLFTKMGEEFNVKVEDLPPQSHAWVKVQCDFCKEIVNVKFQNYNNRGVYSEGYACTKCKTIKAKRSCKNKYGVDWISQSEEIKEKQTKSTFEKYGVYKYSQLPECKERIKKTVLERYGKEHYSQTEEYRIKVIEHNMEKYGVPYHTQDPEIKRKILMAFENNGTAKTSKPQLQLCQKLKEIYGNCELNKACVYYSLDCVIEVNGVKIDIEFDGEYWHRNREQQDYVRDKFIKSQGYKIIRIKGNRQIPTDEEIINAVDTLIATDRNWIKIITDIK